MTKNTNLLKAVIDFNGMTNNDKIEHLLILGNEWKAYGLHRIYFNATDLDIYNSEKLWYDCDKGTFNNDDCRRVLLKIADVIDQKKEMPNPFSDDCPF